MRDNGKICTGYSNTPAYGNGVGRMDNIVRVNFCLRQISTYALRRFETERLVNTAYFDQIPLVRLEVP